jgi:opacity protein-like surface antigen
MLNQLLIGGLVSLANVAIHGLMTGFIVLGTHRIAAATDELHVFVRVTSLMLATLVVLMATHVVEISVWASYYALAGIETEKAGVFEFAFENYTALGYGDAVAGPGYRLIGPITSLNGLLLIGWSVALILEVMRMAELQVARKDQS